ncbi:DUF3995 domain-containing protein [Paenibacillus terrae]|uniref:DUF3995 domain-containing protein n=1 Tax=Paenibacillus terrae TaxID=159743 RepID=UPI0021CCDD38|nr:DUF3995 domain-containing protein [Paenibacillus terrae]
MLELLTWAVGGILFILSGMHVYWAFGGKRGSKAAIPSTGTALLFEPSKTGTAIVAILLAVAAWFVFELGELGDYCFSIPSIPTEQACCRVCLFYVLSEISDG